MNNYKSFLPFKLRVVATFNHYCLVKRDSSDMNRLIHGKFQGANNCDFKDAKDLGEIVKAPEYLFDELKSNTKQKFRFVRYISPKNGSCNIAEIKFISAENKQLNGKFIG